MTPEERKEEMRKLDKPLKRRCQFKVRVTQLDSHAHVDVFSTESFEKEATFGYAGSLIFSKRELIEMLHGMAREQPNYVFTSDTPTRILKELWSEIYSGEFDSYTEKDFLGA